MVRPTLFWEFKMDNGLHFWPTGWLCLALLASLMSWSSKGWKNVKNANQGSIQIQRAAGCNSNLLKCTRTFKNNIINILISWFAVGYIFKWIFHIALKAGELLLLEPDKAWLGLTSHWNLFISLTPFSWVGLTIMCEFKQVSSCQEDQSINPFLNSVKLTWWEIVDDTINIPVLLWSDWCVFTGTVVSSM